MAHTLPDGLSKREWKNKMTSDQWFAVVMIAVSAFLGWCVTMAVYDIALWGAV